MLNSRTISMALGVAALCVGTPHVDAARYTGGPVTGGGSVTGKVIFTGKVTTRRLKVTQDAAVCGQSKPSQRLLVGSGGALKNAVVYLRRIKRGKPAKRKTLVIDQKGCTYFPHVQATVKGSRVLLRNSDPVLHNVHGVLRRRVIFNVGLPNAGQTSKKRLRRSGVVHLKCDAGHKWMSAYIRVFSHPYFAVTGSSGSFTIGDIPPGTYKLVAWHEKLGKRTVSITISAGGAATTNIVFR